MMTSYLRAGNQSTAKEPKAIKQKKALRIRPFEQEFVIFVIRDRDQQGRDRKKENDWAL